MATSFRSFAASGGGATLVFGIAVVTFARALACGFLGLDDPEYVTRNPWVVSGWSRAGLWWAIRELHANVSYWHPLTWWSHQLDVEFFGLDPRGHHLTSVLLHGGCSVLALRFARCILRDDRAAWVAGLIFAVHPLHVESVVWVAERKDLLCGLFCLATMGCWFRFLAHGQSLAYAASLAGMIAASLAKPTAVALPLALGVIEVFASTRATRPAPSWPLRLGKYVPFLAIAIGLALVTLTAQQTIGAVTPSTRDSVSDRLDNAGLSLLAYLRTFVWPAALSVAYGRHPRADLLGVPAALALVLLGLGSWRLRRALPEVPFGFALFLVFLLPTLGLVQAGPQSRADRYMYLPVLGLGLAAVALARAFWNRFRGGSTAAACAAAAGIAALAATTATQVGLWQDEVRLLRHAVRMQPEFWFARLALGGALAGRGEFNEALQQVEKSVALGGNAEAAARIRGYCLLRLGRSNEAVQEFRASMARRPSAGTALLTAEALAASGRPELRDEAVEALRHFHALRPRPLESEAALVRSIEAALSERRSEDGLLSSP